MNVTFSLTDVRRSSDQSDYTGQLQADTTVRVTDRDNDEAAGGGDDPATVTDFPFPATVPCAATPATTVGATCELNTTLDAVMPGAIKEQDRSIWQLGAVQVFDGGADGLRRRRRRTRCSPARASSSRRTSPSRADCDYPVMPEGHRDSFRAGVRAGIPLAAAAVLVGISFGVVAEPVMGHVAPIVMSAIVFAGAAQFAATAVLADGGSAAAAIVAGILLNLRFIPMGIAIAPSVRGGRLWRALMGRVAPPRCGQAMVDASWAMANRGGGATTSPTCSARRWSSTRPGWRAPRSACSRAT